MRVSADAMGYVVDELKIMGVKPVGLARSRYEDKSNTKHVHALMERLPSRGCGA